MCSQPPLAQLLFDNRNDAPQPTIPIGKQIGVVSLAADPPGHAAIVETHRNEEGFIERSALRAIERIADLGLEGALLSHREVREAGDEEVRGLDRLLDRAWPVLTWQQLPPVEPGSESAHLQLIEQRSEERRVGKECRSRWSPYH